MRPTTSHPGSNFSFLFNPQGADTMPQGMKVVPLNDKIVVKRLEAEDRTPGGIVLPDTAKEKPRQGKVLSLGEGKLLDSGKRAPFQVKEGDRVLFTSYAGNEVTVDGEELLIMTEDDILAVVE